MSQKDKKIDGKKEAAQLLASLPSQDRDRILNDIKKTDPVLAATLQKGLYRFEQVLNLEAPDLQKVIQGLPQKLIALSLRGLDPELKKLLSTKLSARQAQILEEEIQALGPQRLSDVKQAQDKIAAHAGQLHEQGVLRLL